jgi:dihydropteroate synthase-like protein
VLVPGLCGGSLDAVAEHLGVPVEKGPKDLKDLPDYFGALGVTPDLSRYDVRIFAEIVDAPRITVEEILVRAAGYSESGADVIDLGCLPETPFPHLEDAVRALKEAGYRVSVDSMLDDDLLRGGRCGADYLLSIKPSTLWITEEVASEPVLIPENPGNLASLYGSCERLSKRGRGFLADPILDPIHFGFTQSICRYHALRERLPEAAIMMGIGNVTELTDADTTGISALLMGIVSELGIQAILTTQVSPHARTAVREADVARRMMRAAKSDGNLPRRYHDGLMALRERKPLTHSAEEIAATAAAVKDPSFRIQLSEEGLHIYNRDGLHIARDPFDLYPHLGIDSDGGHAFYLGVELARAQIAWQLGKRYYQDRELSWGCVVPEPDGDDSPPPGSTLKSGNRGK